MKTVYVDWTELGPGAEPTDAEKFAEYLRSRVAATIIVGTGPSSPALRDEVNGLFEQWLVSQAAAEEMAEAEK